MLQSRARTWRHLALVTVLSLGVVTGCGDDPSGPRTPVATVVVTGAPTGALRVGATVQLVATTLSSTGAAVSGAPVSWKSSDEAVVQVSSGGLVTARAAGRATVTAASGSGTTTAEIVVVAPLTISLSGGTAALPDSSVVITLPESTRTGSVTFLVGPAPAPQADDRFVPGTIFQIAADSGSTFNVRGATLALRYNATRLPAGAGAGSLQIYRASGAEWTVLRGSSSDPQKSTVHGALPSVGTYAVRSTPIDRAVLSGTHLDGALYTGQTTQFRAVAVTVHSDTLPGRTATWSSSAQNVVTVDAQGTVTAVAAGTAIISATVEGATATTQLQVLARPVASWPTQGDWTTFRGNNQRTGYVDATLDPLRFTRRWEATLAPGGALNEPATGNGNVYVSSNSYFGGQSLWALDAATGTVRWTRAFGSIHSVNGPATGNGRVYVSTGGHQDSFLWSFDATDGTVKFRSAYGNQWSRWRAPAVTSDIVFLGGGYYGGMSAFHASEGTLLWRRDLPQEDEWTPATDGKMAYAFSHNGLLALDGPTGGATVKAPGQSLPRSGTPVLGGGNDVYSISGGRMLAIDLARDVVSWSHSGQYQGVPVLDGTNVHAIVNGQVEARSRASGALAWTWVPQAGMAASGSVIVTRNLLFVRLVPAGHASTGGRVVALDLATRRVVWSYDADGEMALGGGLLVITSRSAAKVTALAVL